MGRKKKVTRRSWHGVTGLVAHSYIDSVFIVLPRMMDKSVFRGFRQSLLSVTRGKGGRYVMHKRIRPDQSFFFVIAVHQPTEMCLALLKSVMSPESIQVRLLEVHVALDLIVTSTQEAKSLQQYVERRLLPSGRSKKDVVMIGGTTYYNRLTRKGVEVAIYSDRASKVTQSPCVHIEWRTIGAQPLRRAGLYTVPELLSVDHRQFWRDRIALWLPPSVETLHAARKKLLAKEGTADASHALREAQLVHHRAQAAHGGVVANNMYVHLMKSERFHKRPLRLFKEEPSDWMLPASSENALWTSEG